MKNYVGAAALDIFTAAPGSGTNPRLGNDLELDCVLGDALLAGGAASLGGMACSLPARVDAAAQSLAGGLRSELLAALRAEVLLEVARRMPPPTVTPTRPTTEPRGTSPAPAWVRNSRTKVCHLVGVGPESGTPPARWTALCGWGFGFHGGYAFKPPTADADACDRCADFAARRAASACTGTSA